MKALYISYDGLLDPLGQSQILPYVEGLARSGIRATLLTFEKAARFNHNEHRKAARDLTQAAGIDWLPRRYHKWPRQLATLWDVANGTVAARRLIRERGIQIVHCRGEVAGFMGRVGCGATSARLLLDVRGLFSDERVAAGSWPSGSYVDRAVRWVERGNLSRADAVVVLTTRALPHLLRRRTPLPPHRVIPTCVDTTRFAPRERDSRPGFGLAYVGSLGSWYMGPEMVRLARIALKHIPGRALFLTPDTDIAVKAGADPSWADVHSVASAEVPLWLRRASASFFLITPTMAKEASCPTKFAEALATGLPVLANRGIGDVDSVIQQEGVGVLLNGTDDASFERGARELAQLLATPAIGARCRKVAESAFSVAFGVRSYLGLYRELLS